MTDPTPWLERLVITLGNLAGEASAQIAYVKNIGSGDNADELALEFDDVYRVFEPRMADLNLPDSAAENLVRLNGLLESMGGPQHAELWTSDALRGSENWSAVRRIAANVLRELDRG
jgi:hypothetical protein